MLQLADMDTETWHTVCPRQLVNALAKSVPAELPIAYTEVDT